MSEDWKGIFWCDACISLVCNITWLYHVYFCIIYEVTCETMDLESDFIRGQPLKAVGFGARSTLQNASRSIRILCSVFRIDTIPRDVHACHSFVSLSGPYLSMDSWRFLGALFFGVISWGTRINRWWTKLTGSLDIHLPSPRGIYKVETFQLLKHMFH